ncbi:hypothetical protein HAX54_046885 [Datura stramonium]|uniref:Uncharacterized protein n=1 Tax=Datura stramonium TaxID=4076 RepID=A0ABS8WMF7_DATST|nr:hypothetical protein [Datura stramonium]
MAAGPKEPRRSLTPARSFRYKGDKRLDGPSNGDYRHLDCHLGQSVPSLAEGDYGAKGSPRNRPTAMPCAARMHQRCPCAEDALEPSRLILAPNQGAKNFLPFHRMDSSCCRLACTRTGHRRSHTSCLAMSRHQCPCLASLAVRLRSSSVLESSMPCLHDTAMPYLVKSYQAACHT